ncbi:MAG: glycosyltransferase family 4 protein [Candidatus Korobacteraceae bacterium]
MARILLSAYACEPDRGSEPAVGWNWATELTRLGHEVWVQTRTGNRAAIEGMGRCGVNFIYYDLPGWMQSWRTCFTGKRLYYLLWQWGAARHVRKLFPESPFDVVQHVTYVSIRYPSFLGSLGIPFYLGPVSGGERVPPKLRKGFSVGERLRERLRDLSNLLVRLDPLLRRGFRQAEKIIVTRDTLSLVPQHWRHKCEVQMGIGLTEEYLDQASVSWPRDGRCFRLLYVGRLLESKGIDIALRAIRQLVQWQLNVRFIIVGDGPAGPRLRKLAERLQISQYVEWVGRIPQPAVEDCYHSADLFLFPSLRDSGGMAVLEALAHGLPVLCTELGGAGITVNWRCGRVLPALEISREELAASFACAVSEILVTPGLRDFLSEGAVARAREFDFQRLVTSVYPASLRPAVIEKHEYRLQLGALVPSDSSL